MMDRKMLIDLLQDGMKYSPGKHRFWISRCFEITVHSSERIDLDEYEGFTTDKDSHAKNGTHLIQDKRGSPQEMFHVGRSIIDLKGGRVVEETGVGWSGVSSLQGNVKKT